MGALEPLFAIILSDDVLLKLSVIQVLGEFAKSLDGFQVLVDAGVVDNMAQALSDPDDPMASLLLPGVLDFFATLARTPGMDFAGMAQRGALLECVAREVYSADPALQGAAIGAIGSLGQSESGLQLLATGHAPYNGCASLTASAALLASVDGGKADIQIAALNASALCLGAQTDAVSSASRHEFYKAWSQSLKGGVSAPTLLLKLVALPFDDVRGAAYHVIQSIASHAWGVRALASTLVFAPQPCLRASFPSANAPLCLPCAHARTHAHTSLSLARTRAHTRTRFPQACVAGRPLTRTRTVLRNDVGPESWLRSKHRA